MTEKENTVNNYNENSSCPVPSRPSLFKTFEAVKQQVEYQTFVKALPTGGHYTDPLYRELCLIIAEMLIKSPDTIVRIRGADMEAAAVQEVYRELRANHLELVVENFQQQTTLIRRKTPYLQTALYNVIFEYEAHFTNLVNHDMHKE